MKKVIAILAMVTLAACVNPASTKTPVVDSAAAKVDSVKVDSTVAPVADSAAPALEVK